MIETETPITPARKPTVAEVVAANLHRTLRVLARVARAQGTSYEGPSLLIARELYGPEMINLRTWEHVYGGSNWGEWDLISWSGRGDIAMVNAAQLRRESEASVSRETSTPTVPVVADIPDARCECDNCSVSGCTGENEHEDRDQAPCDDHGCAQCHGEDYSCDDHDCESCFGSHYVTSCCGYCRDCQTHTGDEDDRENTCSNCDYCRDCGHICGDVG